MKRIFILLFTITLFIFGCATSYQPAGFFGGYNEIHLNENNFKVSFKGNAYTSMQRVSDFLSLRCAEVCMLNGYNYFTITQLNTYFSISSYTIPLQPNGTGEFSFSNCSPYSSSGPPYFGSKVYTYKEPRASAIIMCFEEKPDTDETILNAKNVADSIKQKYKLLNDETSSN